MSRRSRKGQNLVVSQRESAVQPMEGGSDHGQEEAEAPAQAHAVLRHHGVTVEVSEGLNAYEVARFCDAVSRTFADMNLRGRVTLTLGAR